MRRGRSQKGKEMSVIAHTCNPSTQAGEAGGLPLTLTIEQVGDLSELHIARPCLPKKKGKRASVAQTHASSKGFLRPDIESVHHGVETV